MNTVELINFRRLAAGRAPLLGDEQLTQLAAAHAQQMATTGKLSHRGFEQRTSGYAIAGEALAEIPTEPAQSFESRLVEGWMESPEHQRILLSSAYEQIGAACAPGADSTFCGAILVG